MSRGAAVREAGGWERAEATKGKRACWRRPPQIIGKSKMLWRRSPTSPPRFEMSTTSRGAAERPNTIVPTAANTIHHDRPPRLGRLDRAGDAGRP